MLHEDVRYQSGLIQDDLNENEPLNPDNKPLSDSDKPLIKSMNEKGSKIEQSSIAGYQSISDITIDIPSSKSKSKINSEL